MTLFDQPGRELKERGQAAVASHNEDFLETIRPALVRIAKSKPCSDPGVIGYVTIDDARRFAEKHDLKPDHRNAWGAVFKAGTDEAEFVDTLRVVRSEIPSNRARKVSVWAVKWREAA